MYWMHLKEDESIISSEMSLHAPLIDKTSRCVFVDTVRHLLHPALP